MEPAIIQNQEEINRNLKLFGAIIIVTLIFQGRRIGKMQRGLEELKHMKGV